MYINHCSKDGSVLIHLSLHLASLDLLIDPVLELIQLLVVVSIFLVVSAFVRFRLPGEVFPFLV